MPVSNPRSTTRLLALTGAGLLAAGVVVAVTKGQRREVRRGDRPGGFSRLPLAFEENRGQFAETVRFAARGQGYSLFLTGGEAVLALRKGAGSAVDASRGRDPRVSHSELRMRLAGARPAAPVKAAGKLPGHANYLLGSRPEAWRTGVPLYREVRYSGVYPGVDMVYHGTGGRLEYDFVVAPGADPGAIRLAFTGAQKAVQTPAGDLALETPAGTLVQRKPVVYQEIDGGRVSVEGRFRLLPERDYDYDYDYERNGRTSPSPAYQVGFALGDYDRSRPLVIDPVLDYSTFLGGSGNDGAQGVTVDATGNVYLAGWSASAAFPTRNAFQQGFGGGGLSGDAFVAKLSPDGSHLHYATYLGGSGNDAAAAIAVDSSGSAYVAGGTESSDFPLKTPIQPARLGPNDAFVARLDPSGSGLLYSTYLGGDGHDEALGIALDLSRYAYVVGRTFSINFPVLTPLQAAAGGLSDGFVTKVNPPGTALVYSTYLGGSADDRAAAVTVDDQQSAYVTGDTFSANFPTFIPRQRASGGAQDAFVTKLNPAGNSFGYSTYLGGSGFDAGQGIAVDMRRCSHVVGVTSSTNFPTAAPLQAASGGLDDAFLSKLSAVGNILLNSTYLGGEDLDGAADVAVDRSGSVYLAGYTSSAFFPTADPVHASLGGGTDAFVSKVRADGTGLAFSTYLGGPAADTAAGLAVDFFGAVWVGGRTSSADFPLEGAFQPQHGGGADAFAAKIDAGSVSPAIPSNLRATAATDTTIQLAWEDESLDETRFKLERKVDGQPFAEVAVLGPNVTTHTDIGLTGQTVYSYRLRAGNDGGDSGYSNELKTITAAPPSGELKVIRRLDFGKTRTTMPKAITLVLRNDSARKSMKATLLVPESPFGIQGGKPVALFIPPRSTRGVNVTFAPAAPGRFAGALTIQSTDPSRPVVHIVLSGVGLAAQAAR